VLILLELVITGTGTQGQVTSSRFCAKTHSCFTNSFMTQVESLLKAHMKIQMCDGIINANDNMYTKSDQSCFGLASTLNSKS
jgi:hypothetical protein